MEVLEDIRQRLRLADEIQDVEAANLAALEYEERRFSMEALSKQVPRVAQPRQPYFVQTL